jgi:ribosomal protein S18 acetylase RimI-like enzyme
VRTALKRLRTSILRDGLAAVAHRVAVRGARRLFMREEHIWFVLPLDTDRPAASLPDGFRLERAAEADAEALARLPNQPNADALRERIAGRADVYVVRYGDRAAFACSVFVDRTPVAAARGGWLALPPGTVCLEDSGASPEFRGRGVAPAAWSAIAGALGSDGVKRMLTKVAVDNEPSRRAVVKAGFIDAAVMRMRRIGPRTTVDVTPLGPPGAEFVAALVRR